jgi:hypothetical protein
LRTEDKPRRGDLAVAIRLTERRRGAADVIDPVYRQARRSGQPYRDYRSRLVRLHLVPATVIDVDAAWSAWAARTPEGRSVPVPFCSLADAKGFLLQYQQACHAAP